MYIIEELNKTPDVPYGDTFQTVTRYCITWKDHESCNLLITCGIEWLKNPLVKGLIKGAAMKGLSDTAKAILEIVNNGLLSQPKTISRESPVKKKPGPQKNRFLSIHFNYLALFMCLITILLNSYNWYQIKTQTLVNQNCISQFNINSWIGSESSSQTPKSNFVESHFVNGTLNPNVFYMSKELKRNFEKYSEYVLTSKKMASELMNDWILLNHIHESSIEALYQNWILDKLSEK